MPDGTDTAGERRIWALEYLRIAAAFSVVWFHHGSVPFRWIGPAGLAVFLLISFSLLARAATDLSPAAFAATRARRILLPWLFWSAVYLAFALLREWHSGAPQIQPWMLVTGFSLHLWYLPYLFVFSVLVYAVRWRFPAVDGFVGGGLCALLGLVLFLANGALLSGVVPYDQWLSALPTTLLGCVLGRIALVDSAAKRRSLVLALLAGAAAVSFLRLFVPGRQGLDAFQVLFGLAAFCAVGALPLPPSAAVRVLAPLTLGIYVVHPLVMDLVSRVSGGLSTPLRAVLVFFASALLVHGLRRVSPLRGVV